MVVGLSQSAPTFCSWSLGSSLRTTSSNLDPWPWRLPRLVHMPFRPATIGGIGLAMRHSTGLAIILETPCYSFQVQGPCWILKAEMHTLVLRFLRHWDNVLLWRLKECSLPFVNFLYAETLQNDILYLIGLLPQSAHYFHFRICILFSITQRKLSLPLYLPCSSDPPRTFFQLGKIGGPSASIPSPGCWPFCPSNLHPSSFHDLLSYFSSQLRSCLIILTWLERKS